MPIGAASSLDADARLESVRRVQSDVRWAGARSDRALPVPPALSGLLPGGGLLPGSAYSVSPGLLLLTLLAEPSRAGTWCGVIGLPELGIEAAEQAGLNLDRVALVPRPGERWFAITAALAEVLPVVAVRPGNRVREADAGRLSARLRSSGTALLVAGAWPRVEATLSMSAPHWSGVGAGHGYLTSRDVLVTVTSKRSPAPRQARVALPDASGGLSPAPTPSDSHEATRSEAREPLRVVG
ncbi:hypothetical protein [Micropruina sp.]|uniref:hypothetical protein n=1 Tax=Micropruina sp. TaxID=2737536 RepID=UPI0026340C45|nr:hypothetical protein [Micropruina sp.]